MKMDQNSISYQLIYQPLNIVHLCIHSYLFTFIQRKANV